MPRSVCGVQVPARIATEKQRYTRAGNIRQLVVALQAHEILESHEHLHELCNMLHANGGVRLIAVESAIGPVVLPQELHGASIRDIMLRSLVSGGILKLLDDNLTDIEIYGVDDMPLVERSQQAMRTLRESEGIRERAFDGIRTLLFEAQQRYYPEPIARLREKTLTVANPNSDLSLIQQIELIKEAAREVGIAFEELTTIARMENLLALENRIDFDQVKQQRTTIVQDIVERLNMWRRSIRADWIDLSTSQVIVRQWAVAVGLTKAELVDMIRRNEYTQVLEECAEWVFAQLFELALEAPLVAVGSSGTNPQAQLYKFILHLAEQFQVEPAHIAALQMYTDYITEASERMDAYSLMGALTESSFAILERLTSPDAIWLRDIENRLDACYRSLRLEMTPDDAETTEIVSGQIIECTTSLCERLDASGLGSKTLRYVDGLLTPAAEFLRCSRERSRIMVENTLTLMDERLLDRAILAVGGFHDRVITQVLEDHRDLSWTVLVPQINIDRHREYLAQDPDYRARYG